MKQYISFFKLKFSVGLQYRAAALAGIATQIFFGLVYIMVYTAFYKSGKTSVDMTYQQLVSYMWLNQSFFSLICVWHKDQELLNMIRKGDIAYELCRPENTYVMWFIRIFATKLSAVLLRCIPLIIISFLLPKPYNLSLPYSWFSFIMFILILLISSMLLTAIITLMYIFIFYTIDSKGIYSMYCGIAELLAGQIVPIPFLSKTIRFVLELLPFAYISDFTFRVYSGNIHGLLIFKGLTIEIIWLLILVSLGHFLTNKVLKRVVVQGG